MEQRKVLTKHPLFHRWRNMVDRCHNPSSKMYGYYGGRGIYVCDRWRDFWVFVEDMGERPTPAHTIDRIDNGGPYSPENCRWATMAEQSRNKRPYPKKRRSRPYVNCKGKTVVVDGVEYRSIKAAAESRGLTLACVNKRRWVYGMSLEEALTLPRQPGGNGRSWSALLSRRA